MARIVVGVSGASGIVLAKKTIQTLIQSDHIVELVISKAALLTAALEMGPHFGTINAFVDDFDKEMRKNIQVHRIGNLAAPIASGSYLTDGMLVIPCSMGTLAGISLGLGDNLLRRAADVILKEKRRLVLVPRETPLSEIHLEHMLKLARMGAVIIPPAPGWYTHPKSIEDIENFIVGKALDALNIKHHLFPRWTQEFEDKSETTLASRTS